MKKSAFFGIALVVFSFFSAVRVHAQAFAAGTNVISGGIGLGSSLANGYTYGTQGIGLSANYEHGIWEAGPGVIRRRGRLIQVVGSCLSQAGETR